MTVIDRVYSDLGIRSAKQSRLVLVWSCSSLTYLLDFLDEPVMTQFYDRDQQESREPRTNVILTEFSFPPHCSGKSPSSGSLDIYGTGPMGLMFDGLK